MITGPSVQSLGAGAALGLASGSPKRLILIGRSLTKIQPVIDEVKSLSPETEAIFIQVDLLDLSSVRKGAEEIKSITDEVHGLINCAGIMAVEKYQESKDGIESQFAVNHVSHFLLTNLLKDELVKGKGVVVNVSSGGYELSDINLEDVNFDGGSKYSSWIAYAQSKTANLLFSLSLAERGRKNGVTAFAVNPGRECCPPKIHQNVKLLMTLASRGRDRLTIQFERVARSHDGGIQDLQRALGGPGSAHAYCRRYCSGRCNNRPAAG